MQDVATPDRYVLLHIPKTAGTSLIAELRRLLGPERVSPTFLASYFTEDDQRRYEPFDIICGHISQADVDRFFPDRKILTVLREPIERCLSWYHMARTVVPDKPVPAVQSAKRLDIDDFFMQDVEILYRNIFNRQIRQL